MKARMCLQATTLVLAAVAWHAQAQKVSKYQLIQDWKSFVGAANQTARQVFRAAVCEDGSVYLSDGQGRLIRVDSAGQKTNDEAGLSELRTTLALGCDEHGRAVAGMAASASLAILQPDTAGRFSVVQRIKPKPTLIPFEILSLSRGQGYVVLGMDPAQKQPLHTVSMTGQQLSAFGVFPQQIGRTLSLRAGVNGSILWNPIRQSILYLPENPYELAEFTPAGQAIGVHTRAGNDFHPIAIDRDSGRPLPNDRVVHAALLESGDLLIQVIKTVQTGPMTVSSEAYLEVVDTNLNQKGAPIPPGDFGHLYGSDAHGNLYFTAISPMDGMNIVKAHLAQLE